MSFLTRHAGPLVASALVVIIVVNGPICLLSLCWLSAPLKPEGSGRRRSREGRRSLDSMSSARSSTGSIGSINSLGELGRPQSGAGCSTCPLGRDKDGRPVCPAWPTAAGNTGAAGVATSTASSLVTADNGATDFGQTYVALLPACSSRAVLPACSSGPAPAAATRGVADARAPGLAGAGPGPEPAPEVIGGAAGQASAPARATPLPACEPLAP
eukprot:CAMPEP_0179011038 /NCGR_PEP_ID=MMETSP0796-20121207/454_1 /TAXON_ID=73915 /ORGANISM="Pyrodinium bahamense, Strain pbaha01" /LENGTH=213 /DNA_ID=CAMNT_0020706397 /DNA_START=291 /DNA_END=932 /DNA_ORIENTATION=+